MRQGKLGAIPGTPPNLKNPPSGCRFQPRCKYAEPRCMAAQALIDLGNGRSSRCWRTPDELRSLYGRDA